MNIKSRAIPNPTMMPMTSPMMYANLDATTKKKRRSAQPAMIAAAVHVVFFVPGANALRVNTNVRREVMKPSAWFDDSALDTKIKSDVYQGNARSSVA